jgi:hypothetical protein
METKVCRKCNIDLPLSEYHKPDKNGYYDYKCRKCYKEEYRETKGAEVAERKRLKKAILEEKGVKECNVCKLEFPLSNFKKTNNGYYIYRCNDCYNVKQREKRLKKKIENGCVVEPKLIVKDGFKICNECNLELPISDFYIKNKDRGTYECKCKKCRYKSSIEYLKEYNSIPENRNRIKEKQRAYEKKKALEAKIIRDNLKAEKQKLIDIEIENKRIDKEQQDLIREEKNRLKEYRKTDEYRIEQDKRNKDRRKERFKFRFNNDELFALKKRLRNLVRNSFRKKGYHKLESKTKDIIGISFNEFKLYMESKFVDGMNWENRSAWHIDHIIPLSTAKSAQELIALSHYTNLQPLWAIENLKKGDKLIYTEEELMQQLNDYSNIISEHKMQKILRQPQENVRGYSFHKRDNKYVVRIGFEGKRINIGRFDTPEEASEAYQKARLIYFI